MEAFCGSAALYLAAGLSLEASMECNCRSHGQDLLAVSTESQTQCLHSSHCQKTPQRGVCPMVPAANQK